MPFWVYTIPRSHVCPQMVVQLIAFPSLCSKQFPYNAEAQFLEWPNALAHSFFLLTSCCIERLDHFEAHYIGNVGNGGDGALTISISSFEDSLAWC